MKPVLIGCEESGVSRRAWRAAGFDAFSNDLIPSRDNSPYHLQMDVFEAIDYCDWLAIILHWPCTETCVSGNGTWAGTNEREQRAIGAGRLLNKAVAKCKHVALEQPMTMIGQYVGPPTQRTNLKYFGESETKSMWLWLFGLPKLVEGLPPLVIYPKVHHESPQMKNGLTRAQRRSETRPGFAQAMVDQWKQYI